MVQMIELGDQAVHMAALHDVLSDQFGATYFGLSQFSDGIVRAVVIDDFADGTSLLATVQAHDPVFLAVDRETISADGVDAAIVTVSAPKAGAAPVVLQIAPSAGDLVEQPVDLVGGVGTVEIASVDPQVVTVSVRDGAARTSDRIDIQVV